jgi:hypothetical protein
MGQTTTRNNLKHSYLGGALRSPENWLAAGVTLAVGVAVSLASMAPLSGEIVVELAGLQRLRASQHATLTGFLFPTAEGVTTAGPQARIILNRPLPARFELVVDGRCTGACDGQAVEIAVGGSAHALRLGARDDRASVPIDNPLGERRITLQLPPGLKLILRRITLLPVDSPA